MGKDPHDPRPALQLPVLTLRHIRRPHPLAMRLRQRVDAQNLFAAFFQQPRRAPLRWQLSAPRKLVISASNICRTVRSTSSRRKSSSPIPACHPVKSQYSVPCEPSRSSPDECRLGKQHPKESTRRLASLATQTLLRNFTDLIGCYIVLPARYTMPTATTLHLARNNCVHIAGVIGAILTQMKMRTIGL